MTLFKIHLSILFAILVLCINVEGQTKKYPMPKDVSEKMLASVPVKDGKIFFEEEVTTDTALRKDQIFSSIRKWFADSFAADKSTLETDDMHNGVLTGKGAYKYNKASGIVVNSGFITFAIHATVKDGSFTYQLNDFITNESSQGLTGLASTGIKHTYDLNEVLQDYKNGKKVNVARRELDYMNQLVYYVQISLRDLSK